MAEIASLTATVERVWDEDILPTLVDYIRIPNKSPAFDADWAAHGHMERAVVAARGLGRGASSPRRPAPRSRWCGSKAARR